MRLTTFTSSIAFLGVAACTGDIPTNNGGPDAAGPDASPAAEMVTVSGSTMDYFALTPTPLATTTVLVQDVVPAVTNTSDMLGAYTLQIPPGSTAYAVATHMAYRPTRNVPLVTATPDLPVTENLYVGSVQETANLYNLAGGTVIDMSLGTAVAIGDLVRDNGMPFDNVAIADVTLVDLATPPAPVPGITGPYFFDINGQLDPAITTGTPINGRTRVGILNCPVGNWVLNVNYINGQGQPAVESTPVMCDADGFTLSRTGNGPGGGGGGGGGGNIANPKFVPDIYERLQTPVVSQGQVGRACTGCHNTQRLAPNGPQCIANPASCVPWAGDLPAADVLAALTALPGDINIATPADSLLLTKPLRELVGLQNHPNVTFLTTTDPDYIIFMTWIQQGALP